MDETERMDALVGAERWGDAVAAAGRALAMGTPEADAGVRLRLERARCHIELGDFSGANALSAGPPLWPSALLTAAAWEAAARWARPARRPSRRRPTFA